MENENIYFTKKNYFMILAGIVVFVLGYIIMSGGNPEDPSDYSDEIFNFRRITLAPFIVIAGYVIVLFGIIKNFKPEITSEETETPTKK
ncbi:MAG: DUF3098 domain-containing protein [Flavobacteriales bacterium]|jgi:hypothetical protein